MKRFGFIASVAIAGLLLMSPSGEAYVIDSFDEASASSAEWKRNTGLTFTHMWTTGEAAGGVREIHMVKDPTGSVSVNVGINNVSAPPPPLPAGAGLFYMQSGTSGLLSTVTTFEYDGVADRGNVYDASGIAYNDANASNVLANQNLGLNLLTVDGTGVNQLRLDFDSVGADALSFVLTMTDSGGLDYSVNGTVAAGTSGAVFANINPIINNIDGENIVDIALAITSDPATTYTVDQISLDAAAIPEPSSMVLLATGILGMAVYSRRRRKDKAAC